MKHYWPISFLQHAVPKKETKQIHTKDKQPFLLEGTFKKKIKL
jgi:hypothetical protein